MQVERDSVASTDESGARVSNAYATCPLQGNSPEKFGLMPHGTIISHDILVKVPTVEDGHA